jgi:peptidoglycan/LPS O-acetylase OafA/YrhL
LRGASPLGRGRRRPRVGYAEGLTLLPSHPATAPQATARRAVDEPARAEPSAAPPREKRPEIQALRAIAVAWVIVFHAWPHVLPGGYAGVDVFFVISGFLITGGLLRESARTGRVSLAAFWARRARRLLPAAFVTLLICCAATLILVPRPYWQGFLGEIAASAMYVENWRLAADAVDYHAAGQVASPVKHFWSLSVEEQFYLAWPLLLLVALGIARALHGVRGVTSRRSIGVVLGAVTAASFLLAITRSPDTPAGGYYATPLRAWEFGAGGLLALVLAAREARPARAPRVAAALSWAGLGLVLLAGLLLGAGSDVPGFAALLPVAGALLVIAAGLPAGRLSPAPLLRLRPMQALGDMSYSAYLWHWPLLVALPFLGLGATGAWRGVAVLATLPVAWWSKRLVEDPLRRPRLRALRRPGRTLAFAGLATAFVIAVPVGAMAYVRGEVRRAQTQAERVLNDPPRCFGAAARDPARRCENEALRGMVVPAPIAARRMPNARCARTARQRVLHLCEFGAPRGEPRVALLGDSHASHWRAALEPVAAAEGWRGVSVTRSGCALSEAPKRMRPQLERRCVAWRAAIPAWLSRHPEITTVVVSGLTGGAVVPQDGKDRFATEVDGYRAAWSELPASVRRIVVLRDVPRVRTATVACVQRVLDAGGDAGTGCAVPRAAALREDPAVRAAEQLPPGRMQVIDLSDVFCDSERCLPVIGGALVHKDTHHISVVFARTLAPLLRRQLAGALER